MAGALTISTLSDGTNSTSSTNCIQGSAKAWVNFNGTTSPGTIRASYNVGSVTKNGTGDYTINFTNALSDANYCGAGTTGGNVASVVVNFPGNGYTPTTSSVRVTTTAAGFNDATYVSISVFR